MSEPTVLVAGETLVDFIPQSAGELADVEEFTRRAGGAPANVAVGLARLDETPWLCTTLSTDPFGDFLAERLADEGIPDQVITRVDRPTTLAFVSHDADAERSFAFFREDTADVHFETSQVTEPTLRAADYLVVGGVTLTDDPARSATFALVERAFAADCRVVFDPNTRPELWDEDPTPTFERMLSLSDIVTASREDFEPTALPADGDLAQWLLDRGPDTVLLTEGSSGARVVSGPTAPWGAGEWQHDGYDPDEVVDTTGAGDAFLAGALVALTDGANPGELLSFATAVAAVATTDAGAMTALPDREAVAAFREQMS